MDDSIKSDITKIYARLHNRINREKKDGNLKVVYGLQIALSYMDEYVGDLDESDE